MDRLRFKPGTQHPNPLRSTCGVSVSKVGLKNLPYVTKGNVLEPGEEFAQGVLNLDLLEK